jgi:hypothetical protein
MPATESAEPVAEKEVQPAEVTETNVEEVADEEAGSADDEEYEIEAIMSANRSKVGGHSLRVPCGDRR